MDGARHVGLLADAMRRSTDGSVLQRVVTAAGPMLGAGGITAALVTDEGGGEVIAASDTIGRQLVDLEFALGEGPARTAVADGVEVLADFTVNGNGNGNGHWPVYAEQASGIGVTGVFAFPARIGAISVGVMLAHHLDRAVMPLERRDDARVFAEICSVLLVDHMAGLGDDVALSTGWSNRAVIHQATGMLATQLGMPLSVALARLRAYAFAVERQLDDVARDVVERRLRIER